MVRKSWIVVVGVCDIAWLPDSSFWISDGYVNGRVVKYNKDGDDSPD